MWEFFVGLFVFAVGYAFSVGFAKGFMDKRDMGQSIGGAAIWPFLIPLYFIKEALNQGYKMGQLVEIDLDPSHALTAGKHEVASSAETTKNGGSALMVK